MNKLLGILGGLGPLASAEFLKTIYELNVTDLEQQSPACILYSEPRFPDRTDAILGGSDELLISLLVKSLENLCQMGVSKVVLACVTMHYFLPKVPLPLREKVISLIDLIVTEVLTVGKNHLLLCSNGARQAGIFHKYERWNLVEPNVLLPDDGDQNMLQSCIYQIKSNSDKDNIIIYIKQLYEKYKVDSIIAGCTEFHIINKHFMKSDLNELNYHIVDPLITIAKNMNEFMDA